MTGINPNDREYRTCSRKRGYTKAQAKKAIKRMRSCQRGSKILEIYRCPYCRWWHLGNNRFKLDR